MKQQIIAGVVGSVITAFLSFVFWIIKKSIEKNDSSERLKNQLKYFYSPLHFSIRNNEITYNKDAVEFIETVNKEHPDAVPEFYLSWINDVKFCGVLDSQICSDFVDRVKANYIWLRKKLKYDQTKLDQSYYKYLDCYEKKRNIAVILDVFATMLPFIMLVLSALLFLSNATAALISAVWTIVLLIVVFSLKYSNQWK